MNIRPATVQDAAALAAVEVGALLAAGAPGAPAIVEEVARWRALLSGAGAGWTLLAEDEDATLGLVTTAPTQAGAAAISLLCVLPDRWREGVGAGLLDAALAGLRERGLATVTLRASAQDERLPGLLRQAGFAEQPSAAAGPVPDGAAEGEGVGWERAL